MFKHETVENVVIKKVVVRHPTNDVELSQMYHLRYLEYFEEGYIAEEVSQLDQDEYDASSIHFVAIVNESVVGCARFILPNIYRKFPTDEYFSLQLPEHIDRTKTVEISRLVIQKEYRGSIVLPALFVGMYYNAMQTGKESCIASLKSRLFRKLQLMGFPVEKLEGKQIYSKEYLKGYFHDTKDITVPLFLEVGKTRDVIMKMYGLLNGKVQLMLDLDDVLSHNGHNNRSLALTG